MRAVALGLARAAALPREVESIARSVLRVRNSHRASLGALLVSLVLVGGCATTFSEGPDEHISDFQLQILQDGKVSYAEMESAVLAFTRCISDLGQIEVDVSFGDGANVTRTFRTWRPGATQLPEREVADCDAQYFRDVELAWISQEQPAASDRAGIYERTADCARAAGIHVPDTEPSTLARIAERFPEIYLPCLDEQLNADR